MPALPSHSRSHSRGRELSSRVVIDSEALAKVMRSEQGPVVRELIKAGELVKDEAKRLVGVSRPDPGSRSSRRPGTLRDSIVSRIKTDRGHVVVEVGSDDPIALWHHEGTVPHVIRASRAPKLVFFWPKAGRVVAFRQINHPGTRPNRFLLNALKVLRGRY